MRWLEDSLRQGGYSPLRRRDAAGRPSFAAIAHAAAQYQDVERHPAWRDHMAAMAAMREGMVRELCDGTLDRHGRNNDCCKRAVLYFLNKIISQPHEVVADYERLARAAEEQERKVGAEAAVVPPTGLFGPDDRAPWDIPQAP